VWIVAFYIMDFEYSYLLALSCSLLTYIGIGLTEQRAAGFAASRPEIVDS
jgi:hypothetical protein